jgi:hypothetical protein
MSTLHLKFNEFIILAGAEHLNTKSVLFFHDLVRSKNEENIQLSKFVINNPEIISFRFGQYCVFDYFYDKAVKIQHISSSITDYWVDILFKLIDIVISEAENDNTLKDIVYNPKYIRNLQYSIKNNFQLFLKLLTSDFEIPNIKKLCYSVICRGELPKLKDICRVYHVEKFEGLFSHALRYGRIEIINYLLDEMKIDANDTIFGDILNLDHYTDNSKNMYYSSSLESLVFSKSNPKILLSKQDYKSSLTRMIKECSSSSNINVNTIEIWKNIVHNSRYDWDNINFNEIVELFRSHLTKKIPLTHDFGEKYNTIVFGEKWSNRKYIIEYCIQLEQQMNDIQSRYEELKRINGLQHSDL